MGETSLVVPLWRAIAVFRFASLAYVAALVTGNFGEYAHPHGAVLVLVLMAAWTLIIAYAYTRRAARRWPWIAADLVLTLLAVLATPGLVGRTALSQGVPTLTVAWLAGPVLAAAVAAGRRAGAATAVVLGAADVAGRGSINQGTLTGLTLMLLAGFAVGHVVRLAVTAEAQLQRAIELDAATRERERLAREIHDSVLQVLALVQRRGAHLDGEAGELARLAGQQEAALRALIAAGGRPPPGAADRSTVADPDVADLRGLLRGYGGSAVSLAAPAQPVLLPTVPATEVAAAVGSALDNVASHAGPGARAWVLVEDEPDGVRVCVRDDGPGIPPGRLAEAAAQGRLGVAQSIEGRLRDLGGTARILSTPGEGTEVELWVPRQRTSRSG